MSLVDAHTIELRLIQEKIGRLYVHYILPWCVNVCELPNRLLGAWDLAL